MLNEISFLHDILKKKKAITKKKQKYFILPSWREKRHIKIAEKVENREKLVIS